jgi:hypothetical protein
MTSATDGFGVLVLTTGGAGATPMISAIDFSLDGFAALLGAGLVVLFALPVLGGGGVGGVTAVGVCFGVVAGGAPGFGGNSVNFFTAPHHAFVCPLSKQGSMLQDRCKSLGQYPPYFGGVLTLYTFFSIPPPHFLSHLCHELQDGSSTPSSTILRESFVPNAILRGRGLLLWIVSCFDVAAPLW